MKIQKRIAWKNQKCNECGNRIYQKQDEENHVYFCYVQFASPEKTWKLCKKCVNEIFGNRKCQNQ